MKILLVHTNREKMPDPVAPIGIATIAGALIDAGHEIKIADLCFAEEPMAHLKSEIKSFEPELVGVAIRNIDNTAFPNHHSYLPFIQEVTDAIRATTTAKIVFGGSGFSILPENFMRRFKPDFGVVGEGEEIIVQLVETLIEGKDPTGQPGLITIKDDEAIYSPAWHIQKIRTAPTAGWQALDIPRYWASAGQIPVQSKRGCAFQCTYCTYPLLEGQDIRAREPGEVVDEIERWVTDHEINNFFFVDSVFNNPLGHPTEVLEEILRRELKIGWSAYVSPRLTTPEFAKLMARTGCQGVEVGVDGSWEPTLKSLQKGFEIEHVRRYFKDCQDAGINLAVSLILGSPKETRETMEQCFALYDELRPNAVVAMMGVRVYPTSPIWPLAVKSGQVDKDADPLEPSFYLSEELRDEDIRWAYKQAEARPNWVMPGKDIRMDQALFTRLRDKNVKGPLWRLMRARNVKLPQGL